MNKYKVGDYIEYKTTDAVATEYGIIGGKTIVKQATIIKIDPNNKWNDGKDQVYELDNQENIIADIIIGKVGVLTYQEKEYLSKVIEPFGRKVFVTKHHGDVHIDNEDREIIKIDATFWFKRLEERKEYTLEELGI